MPATPFRFARRRVFAAGMTLAEVMISLTVLATVMGGVLATFVASRRLAAASVAQNCAVTIAQGYIEQIKNIPLYRFVNASPMDQQVTPNLTVSYQLPTLKDPTSTILLSTTPSGVSATSIVNAVAGATTPTGVIDNLQSFDLDNSFDSPTTTWASIWPGATTVPATTPKTTDLRMNFWIQITDLTPTASPKCKAYGILLVYTWQFVDGGKIRYSKGVVRAVRSAVQTY